MRYICAKCGHIEAVTTRKPHCECGGLWKLDDTPPVFPLMRSIRTNGASSATGASWRWTMRAGAAFPWVRA